MSSKAQPLNSQKRLKIPEQLFYRSEKQKHVENQSQQRSQKMKWCLWCDQNTTGRTHISRYHKVVQGVHKSTTYVWNVLTGHILIHVHLKTAKKIQTASSFLLFLTFWGRANHYRSKFQTHICMFLTAVNINT